MIAAEAMTAAPDFGHLEPMLDAAQRELDGAAIVDAPGVVLADAGYWHQQQMERIVDRGIPMTVVAPTRPRPETYATASVAARRHP